MKELKTEIIIDAPKAKVWDILTDKDSYGSWNPFIISMEGEMEEGTRLQNTLLQDGKEYVFKPVITKLEHEEEFEWIGQAFLGMFTGRHYFRLEETGENQTRLIHGEYFTGLLSGFIFSQIGENTLKGFVAMNNALKKQAEEN